MSDLLTYLLQDCYGVILCMTIVVCFMIINRKNFDNSLLRLFSILCALVMVHAVCGTIERYLGNQPVYSPARLVLSVVCYIVAPAILLTITETLLREKSMFLKQLITIPQVINIIVVLTAFFEPWCFSMDPELNEFSAGPLGFVPRIMPVLYLAILIAAAMVNVRKNRSECMLLFISSIFIMFNFVNEVANLVPINFREITIAITLLAYAMYFTTARHNDEVQEINVAFAETEERYTKEMVDQCIETLAYTIDAKDRYTKGHSSRVAKYSRMIAQLLGKSENECRQIYLAGLLHDIGKISINDEIINKVGRLTDDEYSQIKKHPEKGSAILEKMKGTPFLQNGAKYHHERYDGHGYPMGLKGKEIPELARIIAVADAYDAMTSYRSYRPMMDQKEVKQEIWKGMGAQFDPLFARAMISLMDADINYDMREKPGEEDAIIFDDYGHQTVWKAAPCESHSAAEKIIEETGVFSLAAYVCAEDVWCNPSNGILVLDEPTRVKFKAVLRPTGKYVWNAPTVLIYSSFDGSVLGPRYDELGVFNSAGYGWKSGSANYEETEFIKEQDFGSWESWREKMKEGVEYTLTVRREKNTVILRVGCDQMSVNSKIGVPDDYGQDIYISITGEQCDIIDIG